MGRITGRGKGAFHQGAGTSRETESVTTPWAKSHPEEQGFLISSCYWSTILKIMNSETLKPLIVQSDNTLLLDVHTPYFEEARGEIGSFAELEKSPEHMHTYRISPLSLWNAATAGLNSQSIMDTLKKWSRYPIPENLSYTIRETISRYGKIQIHPTGDKNYLLLKVEDSTIRAELETNRKIAKLLGSHNQGFLVNLIDRGNIKHELIKIGYPVQDMAPLSPGAPLDFQFRDRTLSGYSLVVRDYQQEAAQAFYGQGRPGFGFGTVVLACGAGKTIVGMSVINFVKSHTLILTTNVAAVHQWMEELLDKSQITSDQIGEYTGEKKEIKPITIATYQILTWRADKAADFIHFQLFRQHSWGLIIYDEVHLLPAPVFRVTAEIQAVRRLGLTATLVREDGREDEVFSLVGPKRYDKPWKELESKGWIAVANCYEIHVALPEELKIPYATAETRQKYRIAAENPLKITITQQIIANHREDAILVIGQYISQLTEIAQTINAPLITGKTANREREKLYADFKAGKIKIIVVSKVANFAIDLPDASVAIQISGSFGSRQEEAQRLGRILRPKKRNAYFYSLITRYTSEEIFSSNRQKFLTEQGYKYHIENWDPDEFTE